MYYIITENYVADGCYEELINDSCPSIGTYTNKVRRSYESGELIYVDGVYRDKFIVTGYYNEYGQSLCGSEASFYIPQSKCIKATDIDIEIARINEEIKEINDELDEVNFDLIQEKDFLFEMKERQCW